MHWNDLNTKILYVQDDIVEEQRLVSKYIMAVSHDEKMFAVYND